MPDATARYEEAPDNSEFDSIIGIVGDGVVGAAGGLVGTAMATVGLLIADSLGFFEMEALAKLTEMVGLTGYVPDLLFAYVLFALGGMIPWPLLFASLKEYLPGRHDSIKGAWFGGAIWTGFVLAFYSGEMGLALVGYITFTLAAHVSYGIGLGLVFNYLATRPDSIV